MRPQDLLVLIKIFFWPYGKWTIYEIAESIFISKSEVSNAIRRMKKADLFDSVTNRVKSKNLSNFLINGVKYVFPAVPGKITNGIPTAYSAPPISKKTIDPNSPIIVWPYKKSFIKGPQITPIYKSVPQVALQDAKLYELFALIDALRIGKARELEIAKEEISNRLL